MEKEEFIEEEYLEGSPIPISFENSLKIINQMKNNICKIHKKNKIRNRIFL